MKDRTLVQIAEVISAIISCGISITFMAGIALFWPGWKKRGHNGWQTESGDPSIP